MSTKRNEVNQQVCKHDTYLTDASLCMTEKSIFFCEYLVLSHSLLIMTYIETNNGSCQL